MILSFPVPVQFSGTLRSVSSEGLRVLALACKPVDVNSDLLNIERWEEQNLFFRFSQVALYLKATLCWCAGRKWRQKCSSWACWWWRTWWNQRVQRSSTPWHSLTFAVLWSLVRLCSQPSYSLEFLVFNWECVSLLLSTAIQKYSYPFKFSRSWADTSKNVTVFEILYERRTQSKW